MNGELISNEIINQENFPQDKASFLAPIVKKAFLLIFVCALLCGF